MLQLLCFIIFNNNFISGFSNVNKLILRWDQSFWDSESELDTFGITEDTWNDRYLSVQCTTNTNILSEVDIMSQLNNPEGLIISLAMHLKGYL